MKGKIKRIISLTLILCTLAATGVFAITDTSAAGFEAENSYLTYDEYRSLNFNLSTASGKDDAPYLKPFETDETRGIRFSGCEYGWSNPQVLAVMASAPYWSDLYYGGGITSAGSTSFTVSTDESNSEKDSVNVKLGVSVTASAHAEAFGNGTTIGANISEAVTMAESVQKTKTGGTSRAFTAGSGQDSVALMVIPVASYKYEVTTGGKTEEIVINIQLDPEYSITTLDAYNAVARSHNETETCPERMMPVIELGKLVPGYRAGDPSLCPSDTSEIPENLSVVCGDMIIDKSCQVTSGVGENQVKGKVYTSEESFAVGVANATFAQTFKFSESEAKTVEQGVVLSASVYSEVSAGADIGVAKAKASTKVEVSSAIGSTVSYTTTDTTSATYTMTFANLPKEAVTDVTEQGIGVSPYSFNTKLAVWVPEEKGEGVWNAPSILMPLVSFPEGVTLPPYLPSDFHVTDVTADSVTFNWNLSDFRCLRFADKYKIMIKTKGSEEIFTEYEEIDGNFYQYKITGLKPDTSYTFALKAVAKDGTESILGAPVTVKTDAPESPVIISEPKNICVDEGDKAIFEVVPQGRIDAFNYQWYKMSEDRYGVSWVPVIGATENTFNAAYFAKDGKVSGSNRNILDGTTYRCVVTDKNTNISTTSSSAALRISDTYLIDNYSELKAIAAKIAGGEVEYAYKNYNLACDITAPEGEVWNITFGTEKYPYYGTFDGKGYKICGLDIQCLDAEYTGFFGCTQWATIRNLTIFDCRITGGKTTGSLVGSAYRTYIENCNSVAYVTGNEFVGGLVGYARPETFVNNCYVRCALKNNDEKGCTGGLAGYNYGADLQNSVSECYISAVGIKGAVAGLNFGNVRNCIYNGGNFSLLDIDTVGQNAGGTLENNQALSNEELAKVYTRPV